MKAKHILLSSIASMFTAAALFQWTQLLIIGGAFTILSVLLLFLSWAKKVAECIEP